MQAFVKTGAIIPKLLVHEKKKRGILFGMEPNIPTPVSVPPSQRPQGSTQGILGTPTPSPAPLPNVIRTMKMDASEAAKTQNETLVSMALAEEKKKAAQRTEAATKEVSVAPAPKPIGRVIIILGLIVLIVGVGVAIKFALPALQTVKIPSVSLPTFGAPETAQPTGVAPASPTTPLARSLILAQSEKRFIINKETPEHLFALVAVERTAGVTPGNIRNLYFAEETSAPESGTNTASVSANRLLLLANTSVPPILARSLETSFMAGLYGEEGSQATPFLVFKVSSYDTGLAGMLAWEKGLPRFFDTLFGTKFITSASATLKFRDTVISGRDTRTLEGLPSGSISYTFANPTTIVIAGSQSALNALVPLVSAR